MNFKNSLQFEYVTSSNLHMINYFKYVYVFEKMDELKIVFFYVTWIFTAVNLMKTHLDQRVQSLAQ